MAVTRSSAASRPQPNPFLSQRSAHALRSMNPCAHWRETVKPKLKELVKTSMTNFLVAALEERPDMSFEEYDRLQRDRRHYLDAILTMSWHEWKDIKSAMSPLDQQEFDFVKEVTAPARAEVRA
jgi:hypothetical protein